MFAFDFGKSQIMTRIYNQGFSQFLPYVQMEGFVYFFAAFFKDEKK